MNRRYYAHIIQVGCQSFLSIFDAKLNDFLSDEDLIAGKTAIDAIKQINKVLREWESGTMSVGHFNWDMDIVIDGCYMRRPPFTQRVEFTSTYDNVNTF
jgi:hypothetical protein